MKKEVSFTQKSEKKTVFGIVATTLILTYAMTLIIPLVWALLSSVKGRFDFFDNPLGIPETWKFSNFTAAFEEIHVEITTKQGIRPVYLIEMFWWSIAFAVGSMIVMQLSRCCCAYVCAKFSKYWLPRIIYSVVIIVMILPIVGSLSSSMQVYRALGIYDNMLMWFVASVGFTGSYFLIYYASFKNISWEYAEAAFIDGAGHFTVLFKIMMPMIKTTMFGLMLLEFIGLWNDYSTVMIWLPSYPNIAYGLYRFQFSNSNSASSVPVQLAGCMLVMLPILIIYIIFKDKLIGNLSIGGLKG